MSNLRFVGKDPQQFFPVVKQRVDAYFKERNLSKNANFEMYFKTFLFFGGAIATYLVIMMAGLPMWANLMLCVLLGLFNAMIGFNIGHDAIHGSFTSSHFMNRVLAIPFNLIGGNEYVWKISHNLVHHTYTNIPGHDEDIEVAKGLVRLSPDEPLAPVMRYQHIYAFLLYGLASLSWVLRKDYVKFFQKKIGQTVHKKTGWDYFNLFFYKGLHYLFFIVLPLVFLPITWWQFLIGFMAMHFACGFTIGLVFQLAHVVEGTEFPHPNEEGNIENTWAIHQMETTANFACNSWLANFLCGGLNMQIEHHLFPQVCHIHYSKINGIVKQTALEYGVPYIENKTFFGALASHYRTLKEFGVNALNNINTHRSMAAAPVHQH